MLSSPGSGKTALLQRTLADLGGRLRAGVIVGDLATDNDARRIRSAGVPAVQITTGSVCHLEAEMVARAAGSLDLDDLDLLIIENVGNLVCPASYDLGETVRVVLLSVTEGEDKPLKYPAAFQTAQVVVVSKMDLAEAAGFDREAALANIRRVAPHADDLRGLGADGERNGALVCPPGSRPPSSPARLSGSRRLIRVRGNVQGVGFRPFVYRVARETGVAGWVRNDPDGVLIRAEGSPPTWPGSTRRCAPRHPRRPRSTR